MCLAILTPAQSLLALPPTIQYAMEIILFLCSFCILGFLVLATYDGAYLHLWKYELFNHSESKFEHKTHTIRALLFPIIIYLLFLGGTAPLFYLGTFLACIDLIVLGFDAYAETDSRKFMGGLPRWEYIIHLFANAFHFSTVILAIGACVNIDIASINYQAINYESSMGKVLIFIVHNSIPGAALLAIAHLLLTTDLGKKYWAMIKRTKAINS